MDKDIRANYKCRADRVPPNVVFTHQGKQYMWKLHESGNWTSLTDKDGNKLEHTPVELMLGLVEVEYML